MAKTENLGLNVVADSETEKTFLSWRSELAGDNPNSNMEIIDKAFARLNENITWGEYLPEEATE